LITTTVSGGDVTSREGGRSFQPLSYEQDRHGNVTFQLPGKPILQKGRDKTRGGGRLQKLGRPLFNSYRERKGRMGHFSQKGERGGFWVHLQSGRGDFTKTAVAKRSIMNSQKGKEPREMGRETFRFHLHFLAMGDFNDLAGDNEKKRQAGEWRTGEMLDSWHEGLKSMVTVGPERGKRGSCFSVNSLTRHERAHPQSPKERRKERR